MILGFTSLFPFNSLKSRSYTVFQCLNTVISYIVSSFLIVYNRMLSELFYSLMSGNRSLSLICSVSLVTQLCPTFCDPMDCSTPDFPITNSQSLLKLMSIESVMPSNYIILCYLLLLPPLIFPSIRIFSNESVLHIRWPKDWSLNFSISPFNEYSGLISFMMDWLDLLAVQGTLKSFLQHHSSKASILRCSAFFMVQLSHPYMTTGKTIALTRWTFVGKVVSLLFNVLSSLVIAFLPRSNRLLISWLQSPSAVILESPKIKFLTVSIVSPSICHEVMGP